MATHISSTVVPNDRQVISRIPELTDICPPEALMSQIEDDAARSSAQVVNLAPALHDIPQVANTNAQNEIQSSSLSNVILSIETCTNFAWDFSSFQNCAWEFR